MGISELFESALADWRRERPDLDIEAMSPVTRILAAATLTRRIGEQVAMTEGLSFGEYEVLAVLRRSPDGAPVKPSPLAQRIFISPGGLTNRLDRLEDARMINRRRDPADGRSSLVTLTAKGRRTVDAVFEKLAASGADTFSVLSPSETKVLVDALDRAMEQALSHLDRV